MSARASMMSLEKRFSSFRNSSYVSRPSSAFFARSKKSSSSGVDIVRGGAPPAVGAAEEGGGECGAWYGE